MQVFGKFVMNLAPPAMLFGALSQCRISEILNPTYMLAYLTGSLTVLGFGFARCNRRFVLHH
jgi:hypothetical protein